MSVARVVEATLTPSGGTRVLFGGKEQPKSYVYVGGSVFELKSAVLLAGTVAPARPSRVLFGAIHDPRLRVKAPIPVDISVEGETVVAFCPEIEEFGYGPTASEALDDFGKTLCELYFSLETEEERLSENLKGIRTGLRRYLEPRRSAE